MVGSGLSGGFGREPRCLALSSIVPGPTTVAPLPLTAHAKRHISKTVRKASGKINLMVHRRNSRILSEM
jgi:hypothetical protein